MSTRTLPPSPIRRPDRTVPRVLGGRYQLLRRIGAGGMGVVFLAHDTVLERDVAVKVLHRHLAADAATGARFRREARAVAGLSHPNIVPVFDGGSDDGSPFMVMELIQGASLRDVLVAEGRLDPDTTTHLLRQILDALDHAHGSGVVHHDLKPENVLVTGRGLVKVADFGLARALSDAGTSDDGPLVGTPQYLAPERVLGRAAGPRSDLYSAGILTFELLTGRVPFDGVDAYAVAHRHVEDRVPPPSATAAVGADLDAWVGRLTARDGADRPASAADARGELMGLDVSPAPREHMAALVERAASRAAETRPTAATTSMETRPQPTEPAGASRGIRWILGAVLAIAVVGWGGWTLAPASTTTVPNVVGLGTARAHERLESAGLVVRLGRGEFSPDVDPGDIVRVRPSAGTALANGSRVTLTPSLGPKPVAVPNVLGLDVATAERRLSERGLVLGEITRRHDDVYPADQVSSQRLGLGDTAPEGTTVDVTVSRGPRPFQLPDVVGSPGADAISRLTSLGLRVRTIDASFLGFTGTNVVDQVPEAGTTVRRGDAIELYLD
jgi:eukaryotic-like serine/threonine-protein kinase